MNVVLKFVAKYFDRQTGFYVGVIISKLMYFMTILNSLFDPLIFFFRMKIIRESAYALFKPKTITATINSAQMSNSSEAPERTSTTKLNLP